MNIFDDLSSFKKITVTNICGLLELLDTPLQLIELANKIANSSYRHRNHALIVRKLKPKATLIVFSSGKIILLGVQTLLEMDQVANGFIKQLQKSIVFRKIEANPVRITNMIATYSFNFKVDLGRLAQEKNCLKPENRAGVIVKVGKPFTIVYSSGTAIVCGAKSYEEVEDIYGMVERIVRNFKMQG